MAKEGGAAAAPEWLELANTLAVTFTGTELWLRPLTARSANGKRRLRVLAAAWASLLAANALASVAAVSSVPDLPWRALQLLGLEVLLAVLASTFYGLVAGGLLERRRAGPASALAVSAYVGLPVVFVSSYLAALRFDETHTPLVARAVCAALGFWLTLYADARRFCPQLTMLGLLATVSKSLLSTLPVVPLLAIPISTIFLVLVSVVEKVFRKDPSFLDWPIYVCTLYGPFAIVYAQAKRSCLEAAAHVLPS